MAGAALNYLALRTRAAALAELDRFTDSEHAPDWGALVNQAYEEWCWETECYWTSDATLTTVVGQAEYTIPLPYFRTILKVLYDGYPLQRSSEVEVDRLDPTWLTAVSGTPAVYWRPQHGVLRLHPKPDTVSKTITIYGSRARADLSLDTDVPMIPNVYHSSLAQRAAWLAVEPWVRGDGRQALQDRVDQYLDGLRRMRGTQNQDVLAGVSRYQMWPAAERISV